MLRAVYQVGSSVILSKYKDIDYLYIYDTIEEKREAFHKHKREKEIDNHYVALEKVPFIYIGCWGYHYAKLIEGEEIEAIKNFNIFDHKDRLKEMCLKYFNVIRDTDKRWYHILILCYMFERNKTTLTKAQIKNVQQVHDSGITKELKEYCVNIISNLE